MQNPEQNLADELERRINGTQNSEDELGELAGIAQSLKNLPRPEASTCERELHKAASGTFAECGSLVQEQTNSRLGGSDISHVHNCRRWSGLGIAR
ncbi:MAG: hypothetical protein IPP40_14705 [bacterium]|nr:hypothetical protein [bacterium]